MCQLIILAYYGTNLSKLCVVHIMVEMRICFNMGRYCCFLLFGFMMNKLVHKQLCSLVYCCIFRHGISKHLITSCVFLVTKHLQGTSWTSESESSCSVKPLIVNKPRSVKTTKTEMTSECKRSRCVV